LILAAVVAMPMAAQETYENARLMETELNGTAKYVGMGGALDALGADISTIRSNPAGIGLFRHSTANVSFGFVSQPSAHDFGNANTTNASFDQAGFVYSMRSGRKSFLNFSFNYTKSRNFDYILSAANSLNGASQNKQSYIKGLRGSINNGGFDVGKNNNGEYIGWEGPNSETTARSYNQMDYLYWNALLPDTLGNYGYNEASKYGFNRGNTGYIGEYDFNVSGNINDRVYLGLTFGLHDVHYKGTSTYVETLLGGSGNGDVTVNDERKITGTGVDIRGGIIIRPIENSPFRIGLYVATPTWYDLTTKNYTVLTNGSPYGLYDNGHIGESYDYKIYTPWKFGFSLGHTVGDYLAIGATYEYTDYSKIDTRINDGDSYYDPYYGSYYQSSSSDEIMNHHTENTLKGVSTIKLGLEYKPLPDLAIRLGYNYMSSMFDKNGFKDTGLDSEGSYYASATDYTNWKQTNRFTCGLGYVLGDFTADIAYQYSKTDGDFYPFTSQTYQNESNVVSATSVSNKRSQVLVTLGYRF
jgi:hypothetical protein